MDNKIKPTTTVRSGQPARDTTKARRATTQPNGNAAKRVLAEKNLLPPGARDHHRSESAIKGASGPSSRIAAERARSQADLGKMRTAVTGLLSEWGPGSAQQIDLQSFLSFGHTDDTKASSADFGAALAFSDEATKAVTNKSARGAALIASMQEFITACQAGNEAPRGNLNPFTIKAFCHHLVKLDAVSDSGNVSWNRLPRARAGRNLQTLYPTVRQQYPWAGTVISVCKSLLSAVLPQQAVSAAVTSIKSANPFLDLDQSSDFDASSDSDESGSFDSLDPSETS